MYPSKYLVVLGWTLLIALIFGNVSGTMDRKSKFRVVMVRHGETAANTNNLFTGWWDVDLTPRGVEEAKRAGIVLKKHGFKFDVGHTSYLSRASTTLDIILEHLDQTTIEKRATWRLNERHFGMLTGVSIEARGNETGGAKRELDWDFLPPPITRDNKYFEAIVKDPRYSADPDFVDFPSSESLEMAVQRMLPYWTNVIIPQMKGGKQVLIVAHACILRAFVFYLEGCTDNEILRNFRVPNGAPFVYEFDENLKIVVSRKFISHEAATASAFC